jgi:GNAT superfamily N-acetyltransferase
MDLVLRNFRPGDEDAFRLLNEEWIERYFRLEEKDRETLNNPRKILDAGGQIVMALLGEERVGCCALICTGAGEFEIAKMTVTDKYRGRGFGRAVLAGTIDEARGRG